MPLDYINRKPEVEVINKNLNPQVKKLIEEAGLDEDEIKKIRDEIKELDIKYQKMNWDLNKKEYDVKARATEA